MRADLWSLASELARRGEPFAVATVVRREPPSSAQVGDAALVAWGGAFHGWVGGSCAQPTVVREALRALTDGEARLIALSPDPAADRRPGVTPVLMTCHSGGSVDIYIQPHLPAPRLLVFGASPVARALVRLAKPLGYAADAVDPDADRDTFPDAERIFSGRRAPGRDPSGAPGSLFAVVATMGQWDEEATAAALELAPDYLGLVASRTRWAEIRSALSTQSPAALQRITCPAGLDIGAKTPEEIALSVLAQIVERRRAGVTPPEPDVREGSAAQEARDPVCGMMVDTATARHRAEVGGRTYYFCCGGCRERFVADPARYLAAAGAGGIR